MMLLLIVSHLICFYAVNDYRGCLSYVSNAGAITALAFQNLRQIATVIRCRKNTLHRAVSLLICYSTTLVD